MKENGKEILQRPVFTRLLFAQCWEDPRLNEKALQVRPGEVVLSVTSGGCNTLSLLLLDPSEVISIDLNDAQSWLLELKMAGIRALTHGEYLEFLGVRPSPRRLALYQGCRSWLTPQARGHWDDRRRIIKGGVLRAGRYEHYLAAFRRLLIFLQGRRKIRHLFELRTLEEQRRFYQEEWDNRAWRLFFRIFFSRFFLGRAGLDPDFFTYVDGIGGFGEHFRALARHALVDLPIRDNYFLAQICLGRYLNERCLPPYLLAENFSTLRQRVDRIKVVTGELGQVLASQPDESVDCFNLSNVFEWVSPEVFKGMLRQIHRISKPQGRLCYWNLLVRRQHPPSLDALFIPRRELAERLLYEDRSFVYSNFEVASVKKLAHSERKNHARQTAVEVSGPSVDPGRPGLCHAGRPEDRGR
jgi:S-adenosylmethionine-diacylglycerol 3-amino-3-carboxypropyl transferase